MIIATYRLLFTFLILVPFSLANRGRDLQAMTPRQILLAAASGFFLALHFVTWFTSLKYTSLASSVVLVTLQPVFVVIGSRLFFNEKVPRKALFGVVLALAGSFVIGAADFQLGMRALIGDILALIAAVMVSGYLLIGRRLRGDVGLTGYTFVAYGCSALTLVVSSGVANISFYPYQPREWLLFLALAVVCTIVGHTVFNWVLRYVQASVVAVSVLGEPLGAILWASIFLGENPTPRQMVGGFLILSGLYMFTRVSAKG